MCENYGVRNEASHMLKPHYFDLLLVLLYNVFLQYNKSAINPQQIEQMGFQQ